jgi:hypothetical protein
MAAPHSSRPLSCEGGSASCRCWRYGILAGMRSIDAEGWWVDEPIASESSDLLDRGVFVERVRELINRLGTSPAAPSSFLQHPPQGFQSADGRGHAEKLEVHARDRWFTKALGHRQHDPSEHRPGSRDSGPTARVHRCSPAQPTETAPARRRCRSADRP